MRSLLIIAHGSRREESNLEIRNLTERIAARAKTRFGLVQYAFLELASPSIPEGIQTCIDAGATEIIIFPYFLSAGNHVAEDIPAEVNIKRNEHPEIRMHITDYIGKSDDMADLLLNMTG